MIANLIDIWYRITLSDFIWRDINWTLMEVLEFILMSVQINSVGLRSIQVKFHSIFFQKEIIQLRTQVMSTRYENFLISVFNTTVSVWKRSRILTKIYVVISNYLLEFSDLIWTDINWTLEVPGFILMSVQIKAVRLRSVQVKVRWIYFQNYSTANSDHVYDI